MITLKDYLTASNSHPERENHKELTPELIVNAEALLYKVNNLLKDFNIQKVIVSSGFRPSDANAALANSAKRSLHMTCQAIDIADVDGSLDKLLSVSDPIMKKYGLWQEDPASTPTWCHIDVKDRGKRPKNQFIP